MDDRVGKTRGIGVAAIGIADTLLSQIKGVAVAPEALFRVLLLFWTAAARQTLDAIIVLADRRFGDQCYMLSRVIVELSLIMEYIQQDPVRRARLYWQYEIFALNVLLKTAKDRKESGLWEALVARGDPDVMAKVRRMFEEIKGDYPDRFRWAGKGMSIKKMAESIGDCAVFDVFYSSASEKLHGSPATISHYLRLENDHIFLKGDANPSWSFEALVMGTGGLLLLLGNLDEQYKGGKAAEIEDLLARLKSL